jgi:serine/threonine protein kinase
VTPEQWARVNTLFHAALEHSADDRPAWLSRTAADDDDVRREVEALLAAHEREPEFLEQPGQRAGAHVTVDTADPASLVGRQLGAYEVIRELGRGGMAVVYLAHDPRLRRDVAIKVVRGSSPADHARRERLRREARAVALLTHPGIATIHALEEHGDELYIVTEYVRGETLRDELARGPLSPEQLLDTAIDITTVVAAAHATGIIHRDLKPENVMRTPSGDIKILDFGLARASGSWAAELTPALTHAGGLLGTPAYMAPEQILGTDVDERADIFALGVMFYELACGAHPFGRGSIASTLHRIVSDEPAPLAEHGCWLPWLQPILERCFKKDPAERYASAHELLQQLLQVQRASHEPGPGPILSGDNAPGSRSHAATSANASTAAETVARTSQWWWWQFHQLAVAAFLAVVVVPAWRAWDWIGHDMLRELVRLTTLAVVTLAVSLRLHVWFVSRYDPSGLGEQRPRTEPWIRLADWGFSLAMLMGAFAIMPAHPEPGALFLALSICYAVVFLVVEPATTRAAFRNR